MKRFTIDMANRLEKKGQIVDPKELAIIEENKQKAFVKQIGGLRTGFFDLETSDLSGDRGHILTGVILEGEFPHIYRREQHGDEHGQDKLLGRAICKALQEYDLIVTFFGHPFDWKMLETRLIHYGYKELAKPFHCDLYFYAKKFYNLHSGSLETLASHLDIQIRKTHLHWDVWNRADHGSVEDMDYVVDHCVKDTVILQQCFDIMKYRIDNLWRR